MPNKLSRFWQELKRRNVLRTLAVYAGTAFVILEAADILFSRWGLPEWAFDLVFYLLIFGALVTLITSWIFDVTPEGLERTKPISEVRKSDKPVVSAGWKAATYVSVVVIIGLVIFNVFGGFKQAKAGALTSIMILPFENYTGDETLDYLVSGMQSELIGEMGQISNLRVISETTSRYYREKGLPLHQIARELGIDAVIEPTVMCHGDSLCVQVKLIGVQKEEKQLWVGDYTEDKSHILNLYSNVSRRIANEVKVELTDEEADVLARPRSVDPDAYEAVMKARFYQNKFTPESLDSAMKYFELAKEIDPEYAMAYLGISGVWGYRRQIGLISPEENNTKAMDALMKAYELDSMDAEVQSAIAASKVWGMYDWAGGEAGFKKSLSLNPNNANTHAVYSHLLNYLGRPDEAMEHIQIALKLDPMNPFILSFYGIDLTYSRKYEEAIRAFQDALQIEPGYGLAWGNLWRVNCLTGQYERAWETFQSILTSTDPGMLVPCEQAYADKGLYGALNAYAAGLELRSEEQYLNPTGIANLYTTTGENDKAIFWLERAWEVRDPNLPYLLRPFNDHLRGDPRFQDLCRRMNLPYRQPSV